MDAIDRTLEESIRRRQQGIAPEPVSSPAPRRAAERDIDPFSPEAILRAPNEDDDLYDPYSDYMDMLANEEFDEFDGDE